MAKNKVVLRSNFNKVRDAGDDAIKELIHDATRKMEDTAKDRLDRAAGKRGYDLNGSDISAEIRSKDGKIEYPHWYGRFFEYGTVHIQAMPFMRPGHRAGRKEIKNAPEVFDKWMRRKARVR